MKKFFMVTVAVCVMIVTNSYAQVGMPTNNPNKDAVLDLNRTDGTSAKGLLLPKVELTDLTSPAPMTAKVAGMHIWNTATGGSGAAAFFPGEYYNDGFKWVRVATSVDAWFQDGNNNGAIKAIGTNDNFDLPIETNGVERMRVTSAGKVGIGTNAPSNNLELNGSGGTATGLKLPTGASSGKVLTSDIDGNAVWQSSSIQLQTSVAATGNQKSIAITTSTVPVPLRCFNSAAIFDDVRIVYGAGYGWDGVNQQYKAPRSGKYRITLQVYFQGSYASSGENWRAFVDFNNSNSYGTKPSMPFISITTTASDDTGFCSGIVSLNADDIVNVKVINMNKVSPVYIWAGGSHTLLTIESL